MFPKLNQKVVLISGASAGIGAACAHAFAAQGARLILLARRREPLEALAEQLRERYPQVECLLQDMDVNDFSAWTELRRRALAQFACIDVVVNNAGLHHRGGVVDLTPEQLAQMVQTNVTAPLMVSRLFLDVFFEQAKVRSRQDCAGIFIHIASLAGRTPMEGIASYGATKSALRAFSYALDDELRTAFQNGGGARIRSCLVSPGPVSTGFILDALDKVSPLTFSQKMATPEDVAALVVRTAMDGRAERCTGGTFAPFMTHFGYLFPSIRRALKPMLMRKGLRQREAQKRAG